MIRRDVERPTEFSKIIKRECNIFDLQGLCRYKNDYTVGVEAIDMEDDPIDDYITVFTDEELYAKAKFAERLNAAFVMLLHKKSNNKDEVVIKKFKSDDNLGKVLCMETEPLSSDCFVNWWKDKNSYVQKKPYRDDMKRIIKSSYFDQLLESNSSSWTGNIDGFTLDKDKFGKTSISSIIEFRFSSQKPVDEYDPKNYFFYNGGDYKTWSFLFELSQKIDVPLYLFTYSRILHEGNKVGITRVINVDGNGITYKNDLPPCKNIYKTSEDVKKWIKADNG